MHQLYTETPLPKVLLLGKLPPPYMGPAIATKILLDSGLKGHFTLLHLNTNVHTSLDTLGTMSLKKVPMNLAVYASLFTILWREKPDLVLIPISQTTIGFVKDAGFILLSALMGRKTLIQLRGSNFKNWLAKASWVTNCLVSWTLKEADGVIVLGEKLRYLFEDYFPREKIYVSPNGADYPLLENTHRSAQGLVKVLYLANLLPSKGIEDLIRGVGHLKEQGKDGFRLDVVGKWVDAGTRQMCESLVKDADLPVVFHGPATGADKFKYLSEADIFTFVPRDPEGHPWVIVEACAACLPIISTDQGAITESVHDGVNGFIVAPRNPQDVAEKLQLLLQDEEMRMRFGKASRAMYLKQFTEEKMVDRYQSILDDCLS